MLNYTSSLTTFSVPDLGAARAFYGNLLGLPLGDTPEGGISMKLKSNEVLLYPKPNHTPATFTVLNFIVPDIESAVDQLTAAGVRFLQYDDPIKTDARGIFRGGGPLIAWFTDPGGNILSVIEQH
jgi:catechol 2,3-dioxygenase-like lactoylglutathione lyase family enzyme